MSKFIVSFPDPIVVDGDQLATLFEITGQQGAEISLVNVAVDPTPVAEKPKQTRRRASPKASPASKAKDKKEKEPEQEAVDGPEYKDLLKRFTKLVSDQYEVALGILDELGVKKFGELEPSQYLKAEALLNKASA